MWYDLFDFAVRVEWLGIGLRGNRTSAPRVEGEELGRVLLRVVGEGKEAQSARRRAKALGDHFRGEPEGREVACERILHLIETP
jgi:hypothetical protein